MTQITHIPPWYKSSPLGPIPNDWKVEEMKNITTLITNGFVWKATDHYVEEDGILYIQGYNAQENGFDFHWVKYVSREFHEQHKKSILREWDLLTIQTWDVGVTAYVTKELEGANCHALIISRYIDTVADSRFYHQFFNSPLGRKFLKIIETGSTMKHLNCGDMETLKLPVPPLEEQAAIVNLFSTWDEAISKVSKLIELNNEKKKGLIQKLLTWKIRLSWYHDEVKLHPVWKYLKEISERYRDTKWMKVLSVTNSRGFIDQADQFDRSVASQDTSNYKIVRKWQFAYNPSRVNVGSLDLLRNFESGILSPMYVVFEVDKIFLIPKFFFYQLKSHWFTWRIPMYVQGSVRDSLSFDWLCGMKFFIPSLEEQSSIVDILEKSDQEIQLLRSKLEKLKEQKKWLMQQLLTGKKRLKF